MSTQTIIVYRNPLEEAFWNALMSGMFTPFLFSFLIGIVVAILVKRLLKNKRIWGHNSDDIAVMSFFVVFAISLFASYLFGIKVEVHEICITKSSISDCQHGCCSADYQSR